MKDPFPFAPSKPLARWSQPLADAFDFKTLPLHVHEVLFAAAFYLFAQQRLAPLISKSLFPRRYAQLDHRTKINWDIHIVSFIQSCFIDVLALYVLFVDKERKSMDWRERLWGYTGACGLVQSMAAGYFLWDLVISVLDPSIGGYGFLAHAACALTVFSLGYGPFVNYYGPVFILYEISSPFLNVHWFCDKLNLTGSDIQFYNGIVLLTTFFGCRLVWGIGQTIRVFGDFYQAHREGHTYWGFKSPGPVTGAAALRATYGETMDYAGHMRLSMYLPMAYLTANVILNGLNIYWFGKMIATIRKRFDPPFGTRTKKDAARAKIGPIRQKAELVVEGTELDTIAEVGEPLSGADGKVERMNGANGVVEDVKIQRGIDEEGRRTVEVEKKEVRKRRKA